MNQSGKFSPLVAAIVLLAGFLGYINWPKEVQQEQQGSTATPVVVAKASVQRFPVIIEGLGTAFANESVTLSAQQTDTVRQVTFDDGDFVKRGQLLVQLEDTEEQARINELQVNLVEANRQLKRIQNLQQEKVASEQLLDEQLARVQSLEAQIEVARSQLRDLQIRAPFAGQLGIRQISTGSLLQPGTEVTTLDDISVIKVDFSVAEIHLASLQKGQQVSAASIAYPDLTFEGQIATIDPRVDPVTRAVRVRALIDNSSARLRPGMLLQISLQKRVLDTLVIPEKALVPNEDRQFVYVLDGDKVNEKEVSIGERRPGWVEIVDGLTEGQQVVVEGTLRVRDQSKVKVLRKDGE